MNPQSDCGTPTKKQTIALRQVQRRASQVELYLLCWPNYGWMGWMAVRQCSVELHPKLVFSVGIRSVFLGIYHTDTEGKLGQYFWYSRYEKVRIYSK